MPHSPDIPRSLLEPLQGWGFEAVERFDGGEFAALYAAEARVRRLGMAHGSPQAGAPVACFADPQGDAYVSKWRGLSPAERLTMDAAIVGDKRRGPVWLLLREAPRADS